LNLVRQPSPSELTRLFDLLQDENKRTNLTAIRDRHAMEIQHGEDSLSLVRLAPTLLENARSLIDIGTGAGFPLLPLALAVPSLPMHGVDSVRKKLEFVRRASQTLGLPEIELHGERAEVLGRSALHREKHTLVTARAVGALSPLWEVSFPLLAPGGHLILYKTEPALQESWDQRSLLPLLGAEFQEALHYRLPDDRQDRVLLIYRKVASTPEKFPRAVGVPFNKPLAPR
jgi:16S rRNA (guanine527-N7)-methyltransferase